MSVAQARASSLDVHFGGPPFDTSMDSSILSARFPMDCRLICRMPLRDDRIGVDATIFHLHIVVDIVTRDANEITFDANPP